MHSKYGLSTLLAGILFFFTVTFSSCGTKKKDEKQTMKQQQGPVTVDVMVASPQHVGSLLEVNGTLVASETVALHPEISGRLTYLNVPEGKRVSKGTVIARINDADLRAQMGKVQAQLDLARATEKRYKKLLDLGGLNQADYDVAINQVNTLTADMNILQAQLAKTVVRAPFTGIVGLRNASPGAFITPSDVIATFHNTDQIKVDFTVPEQYAGSVQRGSYVTVESDGGPRRRARVLAIEPQANTATRSIIARAVLENGSGNPGAFAKVYIDPGGKDNTILVPSNAIIPEDKDKTLVLVKNGKALFVKVETGIRQENNVEITSGIQTGDTIVVSGVLFAKQGSPVKVRSVKTLETLSQ